MTTKSTLATWPAFSEADDCSIGKIVEVVQTERPWLYTAPERSKWKVVTQVPRFPFHTVPKLAFGPGPDSLPSLRR